MTKEIDCYLTDEIVCPYCGHEHSDSCEIADGERDGIYRCDKCNKTLRFEANYSVTYTTEKAPCLNNEGDHDWSPRYSSFSGKQRYCRFCDRVETLSEGKNE